MQRMIGNERRRLDGLAARLRPALERSIAVKTDRFMARAGRFDLSAVNGELETRRQSVAALTQRIADAGQQRVSAARNQIDAMDRLRLTLGYEATLTRGYAVVRGDGDVVATKKAAGQAQALEIQFADGRLVVGGKAASTRKAAAKPLDQGSLF
jgi:exodeoxyribonuclease VII large subunit